MALSGPLLTAGFGTSSNTEISVIRFVQLLSLLGEKVDLGFMTKSGGQVFARDTSTVSPHELLRVSEVSVHSFYQTSSLYLTYPAYLRIILGTST